MGAEFQKYVSDEISFDDYISKMQECRICMGCFTGKYPMEPPKDDIRGEYFDKEIDLERKMLNR